MCSSIAALNPRLKLPLIVLFATLSWEQSVFAQAGTPASNRNSVLTQDFLYENDLKNLWGMIGDRAVRHELRFSTDDFSRFRSIRKKAMAERLEVLKKYHQLGGGSSVPREASLVRRVANEEIDFIEKSELDQLLTPERTARLQQLARYREIGFWGLSTALKDRPLGEEIGVVPNQFDSLRIQADKAKSQADLAIATVRREAHKQVLALLTPEQRQQAQQLMGEYFDFYDENWRGMQNDFRDLTEETALIKKQDARQKNLTVAELAEKSEVCISRDFSGWMALFVSLNRTAIRQELGMSKEQIRAYMTVSNEITISDVPIDLMEQRMQIAVDELLTPQQFKRTFQVAHFIELASLGYNRALSEGNLGKLLQFTDQQKTELTPQILSIEQHCETETLAIRQREFKQVINTLTPEQQMRAEELLGEFFLFPANTFAFKREHIRDREFNTE